MIQNFFLEKIKIILSAVHHLQFWDSLDIKNIFSSIILVVSDQNGSKGYGFVHFESDEAAQRSIEKVNGMMLAEKKVFVGRFKSRNDRLREFGERAKVQ